jgi:hypothetical protein
MLARAKLLGWESEGANLSGAKLKELYFTISGYLNVKGRTDNWMYISNTLKPDALRALAKRIYQYN